MSISKIPWRRLRRVIASYTRPNSTHPHVQAGSLSLLEVVTGAGVGVGV